MMDDITIVKTPSAQDEILALGGKPPQTVWIYDTLLDVSYEVDLFGRISRSIEAARAAREYSARNAGTSASFHGAARR